MKQAKRNPKTAYVLRVHDKMGSKPYLLKQVYPTALEARISKNKKLKNYYQIFVEFKRSRK